MDIGEKLLQVPLELSPGNIQAGDPPQGPSQDHKGLHPPGGSLNDLGRGLPGEERLLLLGQFLPKPPALEDPGKVAGHLPLMLFPNLYNVPGADGGEKDTARPPGDLLLGADLGHPLRLD